MLGIHESHDLFYWQFWRTSRWLQDSEQKVLATTAHARCLEKTEKDFAFVDVLLEKETADVSELVIQYSVIDQAAIIGEDDGDTVHQ